MAAVKEVVGFKELKAAGIVANHPNLLDKIKNQGFPAGFWVGPNSHRWLVSEINDWLASRPLERPGPPPWAKREAAEETAA
jgi:hypothetical protein